MTVERENTRTCGAQSRDDCNHMGVRRTVCQLWVQYITRMVGCMYGDTIVAGQKFTEGHSLESLVLWTIVVSLVSLSESPVRGELLEVSRPSDRLVAGGCAELHEIQWRRIAKCTDARWR